MMWRNVLLAWVSWIFIAGCEETPPSEARGDAGTSGIPCAVEKILASQCRSCHGETPLFGASSSLLTHADFHRAAYTQSDSKIHEAAHGFVAADVMPPGDVRLSAADKATLLSWLEDGAPSVVEACSIPGGDGGTSDGGGGGDGGTMPPLPCEPTHTFVAHADGNPEAGYPVPKTGNEYTCFAFRAPFQAGEQATAWAPVTDDARVLHHWILFETKTPQVEGRAFPCRALPENDAKFLVGWAPGGEGFVLPDDVGLGLSTDSWLLLQIHYWNFEHDTTDRSGVAMCTTTTPRTHTAGVVGVGTTSINVPANSERTVTGTCSASSIQAAITANGGQPITILGTSPHMHQAGIRFRSEIVRADESVEVLTNVDPYRFDDQRSYALDPPKQLFAGDAVRSHCTYRNQTDQTIRFGENTEDEMCYDYLLLYPMLPSPFPGFTPSFCTQ